MTTSTRSSTLAGDTATGEEQHPLTEAGQEAGQTAGRVAERAAGIGFQQADRVREQAAEGLQQLASKVRQSSTDLESEQPAIANIATTAADQAEKIAGFLRETDARQLVQSVEDVARRQPLLFVGGAFILGIAASRFIKAAGGGTSRRSLSYGGTAYGRGTYGQGGYDTRGYGAGTGTTAYGSGGIGYEATGPGGTVADVTEPIDEESRP